MVRNMAKEKAKEGKQIGTFNDYSSVIMGVVRTEKAVNLVSYERVIMFVVDRKATKAQIKEAVENLFKARVEKVRTHINRKGQKIAFVKFAPEIDVESIATSLKIA